MKKPKTIEQALEIKEQRFFVETLKMGVIKNDTVRDVFYIQLETGMRPGEAVAIQWRDVDFETATLTVRHTAHRTKGRNSKLVLGLTKSRCERKVPLSENALRILKARWNTAGDTREETLVFHNKRGRLVEPNGLNRYLRQCQEKMHELAPDEEIPNFTAHALRHTFATRALERGVPQKVVAVWLGHSTTRITGDVYSKVLPEISRDFRQYVGNIINFDDTAEKL